MERQGLELVEYNPVEKKDGKGQHYWHLDMTGVFLESKLYKSKQTALYALITNNIDWHTISVADNF